ncbi:hypothetical protein V6N13_048659 [Hibiscus sabdariffa]
MMPLRFKALKAFVSDLVTRLLSRELQATLKELALDKSGRRLLLQLLHPNCSRYLNSNGLAFLNLSVPSLSAKKLSPVKAIIPKRTFTQLRVRRRRRELLVKSGLAENLVDVCIKDAAELLTSNFGREVIFEVAMGGSDGILHPTLDEKLNKLHEAINLKNPKHRRKSMHVLENFHSGNLCQLWAQGHSSKVVCAFWESSDSEVRKMAKEELVDDS